MDNSRAANAAILILIAAICTGLFIGARALREVGSARVLCPVIDEDGGVAANPVNCGAGGYTSVTCTNENGSANTVYLGAATVTADDGYPICSVCAGGSALGIDTHQGQMYCATNSASADGGTPILCICGY